jgi:hypothetical protein
MPDNPKSQRPSTPLRGTDYPTWGCVIGATALAIISAASAAVGYELQERKRYDLLTHIVGGLITGAVGGAVIGVLGGMVWRRLSKK